MRTVIATGALAVTCLVCPNVVADAEGQAAARSHGISGLTTRSGAISVRVYDAHHQVVGRAGAASVTTRPVQSLGNQQRHGRAAG